MEEKSLDGSRKAPYVLWMVGSFGLFALSLTDESIRGVKLALIFLLMAVASSICALKLRRIIHGVGRVPPHANTVLSYIVPLEAILYLWFSWSSR